MTHRLLFMTSQMTLARMFWNDNAAALADKSDTKIDIPAYNGDLPKSFDWKSLLPDYDGILTAWDSPPVSPEMLSGAERIRFLGHVGGSVAIVATPGIYDCGVRVTTANSVMSEAVAEWSLLSTLLAARDVMKYMKFGTLNNITWQQAGTMNDLKQMTVGIWGMGDTARHLLEMLRPLRPGRILVASQHGKPEEIAAYGAEKASFAEVFSLSDMVHLLVGVNQENLFRIGAPELAMMKDNATLINAGRARLTQEAPLIAELRSGRIRAILDVFHTEPLPDDSELNHLDNVICTPHNAGYTGRERFIPFLLNEFSAMLSGKPMQGEISRKRRDTMTDERLGRQ